MAQLQLKRCQVYINIEIEIPKQHPVVQLYVKCMDRRIRGLGWVSMFIGDSLDLREDWVGCVFMKVTKAIGQSTTIWLPTKMWRIVTMGHWTFTCFLNTTD